MPGTDAEKRAPPVQWAERRNLLYLFFHVPDSHKPDIQLSTDKLYFRLKLVDGALVNRTYAGGCEQFTSVFFKTKSKSGVEYEVTLNFYKEINAETSKYCISDRGVDFILRKAEDGPYWNQLLKDNKKYPWLKIDFTRWRDEDDSDVEMNEEEFEQMMKRMSGLESTSKDLNDLDTETDEETET